MKKFAMDFKEFALKGNIMALAVGVIIGMAFQGLVGSFTDNILSPILGFFVYENLDYLTVTFGNITIGYGAFITAVINFIMMTLVVFMLVRMLARFAESSKQKPQGEPAPTPRLCSFCYGEVHGDATRCRHCTSTLEG
ncbi:MAG: large conductance mechanosensitive channel protein MscL [Defluviitaleaceae bacterium]|nr:large conductance mechanosensitive channel protein MscL [Defluviitaleaceae bacterium]